MNINKQEYRVVLFFIIFLYAGCNSKPIVGSHSVDTNKVKPFVQKHLLKLKNNKLRSAYMDYGVTVRKKLSEDKYIKSFYFLTRKYGGVRRVKEKINSIKKRIHSQGSKNILYYEFYYPTEETADKKIFFILQYIKNGSHDEIMGFRYATESAIYIEK